MSSAAPQYGQPNQVYYQQVPPPMIVTAPGTAIVGDYPIQCTCSLCGKQIVTRTEKSIGLFAWLICGVLFLLFLWPCACIPFCVDSCKDTQHFCPNCNAVIGVNKKI